EAEKRLRSVVIEERAVSSDNFANVVGGPGFIAELFAVAARTKAVAAELLPRRPLPKDLTIRAPRISSGSAVSPQIENQPITTTDPATAQVASNVAAIVGYVDVAQQDLDMGVDADRAIAADLGSALGAALEQQVLSGVGTADQLIGILNT